MSSTPIRPGPAAAATPARGNTRRRRRSTPWAWFLLPAVLLLLLPVGLLLTRHKRPAPAEPSASDRPDAPAAGAGRRSTRPLAANRVGSTPSYDPAAPAGSPKPAVAAAPAPAAAVSTAPPAASSLPSPSAPNRPAQTPPGPDARLAPATPPAAPPPALASTPPAPTPGSAAPAEPPPVPEPAAAVPPVDAVTSAPPAPVPGPAPALPGGRPGAAGAGAAEADPFAPVPGAESPGRAVVHFGPDRTRPEGADRDKLAQVAAYLRQHPSVRVELRGFTDSVGSVRANRRLAAVRVRVVQKALVAAGVPANRIVTASFGEADPVANNADPRARGRNRRVEIGPLR